MPLGLTPKGPSGVALRIWDRFRRGVEYKYTAGAFTTEKSCSAEGAAIYSALPVDVLLLMCSYLLFRHHASHPQPNRYHSSGRPR
ncbi:hypothetical protein VTK26DRAFT_4028 [Humicola hyalothermophila]